MMNNAKLPPGIRKGVWAEAAMTATHIQNILVSKNTPDPYYLFHEKEAQYARNLRTFGEIGIVYNHSTKILNPN